MNCDGMMSFGDFVFPLNPSIIRIHNENRISSALTSDGITDVSLIGAKPVVISGSGCFPGNNCVAVYEKLRAKLGNAAVLYLPAQKPLFAVLKKLELVCDDTENAVSYSFEFVGCRKNKADGLRRVIFGDDESTLWDYSFRFGLNIDTLVRLNPHIRRPDLPVKGDERVNLC